jgi:FtsP/CotA-like multicopper oxidase with cupredoxin domain
MPKLYLSRWRTVWARLPLRRACDVILFEVRAFISQHLIQLRMKPKLIFPRLFFCAVALAPACFCWSQSSAPRSSRAQQNICPRGEEGSAVAEPRDLRSKNGVLRVALRFRSSPDQFDHMRYCYIDQDGNQAPTLRVRPGDTLVISLKNEISESSPSQASTTPKNKLLGPKHDPCAGGAMSPVATNLHFHGLAVPPVCHQDDTLKTLIEPGEVFEYRVQIPTSQPPGLYWYHPHVHGFTEAQILGGASGALIVEGIEYEVPRVAGLPERVFVIRDEEMPSASPLDRTDPNKPTKLLSINYIPVPYPKYPTPVIKMKPLGQQFWRVLNASADSYLYLGVEFEGKRQSLNLVALDGVPLHYGQPGAETYAPQQTEVFLPPAGRAEFVVTGPPLGVSGRLLTHYVYRGASDDDGKPIKGPGATQPGARVGQDDVDPTRPLASIVASPDASSSVLQLISTSLERPPRDLSSVRPVGKRKLYFSERLANPEDPKGATLFFITEEGRTPAVFDPANAEPSITVHQGDVEDWIIENRSLESHAFHVHQLHFMVVASHGPGWEEPTLRDTINLPAWAGFGQYPSATLRMDFRDPNIVGIVPFHCHILQHVDGGMMGTVRIEPAQKQTSP